MLSTYFPRLLAELNFRHGKGLVRSEAALTWLPRVDQYYYCFRSIQDGKDLARRLHNQGATSTDEG